MGWRERVETGASFPAGAGAGAGAGACAGAGAGAGAPVGTWWVGGAGAVDWARPCQRHPPAPPPYQLEYSLYIPPSNAMY